MAEISETSKKNGLRLFGAGQMMFLKMMIACDPDHDVKCDGTDVL